MNKRLLYVAMIALFALTLAGCTGGPTGNSYKPLSVIPMPLSMTVEEGEFLLNSLTIIRTDPNFASGADLSDMFGIFIGSRYGSLKTDVRNNGAGQNMIVARYDNLIQDPEAYELTVGRDSVVIAASSEAGLFYGYQTLMQLVFPALKAERGVIAIPCVRISDSPAYRYRGMHLDVSRHFFPKEFIFKMLDAMAMHKLNTFHWHLTDDQGWRIEIKKYPELTNIGAWRDETLVGHGSETPWVYDGTRYGGYYTQEDVREVVEYARRLHINILPEIEMPGHAVAALRAYPELSCTGGPIPQFNRWGVSEDVFCAGKDETFELLTGVLEEVAELFPYGYIHIGGDECPKVRWEACPLCQKRIADNNLKDEHELQSYFVRRIEAFLSTRGKKIIGWDEILEGGIADNAAVMSWRGHAGGIQAANMGHDVVMTPHSFVYLDYYQSEYNEPLAIGGMLDMMKVYSIDIMPSEIAEDKRKHIIGAQSNVWTEYMADSKHVEYMVFPRLAALAEALWTPAKGLDYEDFTSRMNAQYARYDALGIGYRVPYPAGFDPTNLFAENEVTVELDNGISTAGIRYTLAGTEPDKGSKRYSEPFNLDLGEERHLKAVTVMPGGRQSAVMSGVFRHVEMKEAQESGNLQPGLGFNLFKGEFDSARDAGGTADTTGVVETVRIPQGSPAENFGVVLVGYVEVPSEGIYTFYTGSDDGVLVFIDNELVVDGDSLHHGITNKGKAALMPGFHKIDIRYFQRLYRQSLNLAWEGPGLPRQSISAGSLFHETD
ncbi:MAG: family 20 glycosylhydrolase [Bacteroidales bacterium]|nr:family 20 glycosylhydrolase [Bacteroidales bacterium]